MNCDIVTPIFTLVGAVVGAIISAIIMSKNSLKAIKKQELIKAASKFRSTFVQFLYELKTKMTVDISEVTSSEDINWSKKTLDRIAVRHEMACIEFEPFVKENKRSDFISVYTIYLAPNRGDEHKSDERLDYYSDEKPSEEIRIRKEIYKRLNDVLKFADI